MNTEQTAEVLNDLVQINNDRIAGYEHAIVHLEVGYSNLRELFVIMINDSKAYEIELSKSISQLKTEVVDGTSGAGKIYRTWMDIKAIFIGGEARSILSACETIEESVQKAYDDALAEKDLPENIFLMLSKQKTGLMESYGQIKQLLAIASNP